MEAVYERNGQMDRMASRGLIESERFESLMGQSGRRAYSMALQLTRNPSEAEDLFQDTVVKAWKGFDGYVAGRPFLNWLLRIMQRAYLDSKRRENPIRKAESIHNMVSPNDGELQELPVPDTALTPDAQLIQNEFRKELMNALDDLPTVYRQAIILCDVENLSYSDIANAQRATVGTVRSRIHRGRKLMRSMLVKRGIVRGPRDLKAAKTKNLN